MLINQTITLFNFPVFRNNQLIFHIHNKSQNNVLRLFTGNPIKFTFAEREKIMAGIHEKIDELDIKILKILQEDSSISNLELSGKIGLSPTPTFERVKKLEKAKVIRTYRADLDAALLGFGIQTFMLVSLSNSKGNAVKSFISQVNEIDEIIECYHITGSSDYLFKILVKDIAAYEYLAMEKIRNINEISSMKTMVVLSTIKKTSQVPLNLKLS